MARGDPDLFLTVVLLADAVSRLREALQAEHWIRKNPEAGFSDKDYDEAWVQSGEALEEAIRNMRAWLDANGS